MSYTDDQWNDVMAFLNDEAEKASPRGIGKTIDTVEEFIEVIRIVEAIKPTIVSSNAQETREFKELVSAKAKSDQASIDLQDQIDNHPGNPNP
jgi:hypothetical protein